MRTQRKEQGQQILTQLGKKYHVKREGSANSASDTLYSRVDPDHYAFVDLLRMEGISQVDEPPTSIQGKRDAWKSQRRGPLR